MERMGRLVFWGKGLVLRAGGGFVLTGAHQEPVTTSPIIEENSRSQVGDRVQSPRCRGQDVVPGTDL